MKNTEAGQCEQLQKDVYKRQIFVYAVATPLFLAVRSACNAVSVATAKAVSFGA